MPLRPRAAPQTTLSKFPAAHIEWVFPPCYLGGTDTALHGTYSGAHTSTFARLRKREDRIVDQLTHHLTCPMQGQPTVTWARVQALSRAQGNTATPMRTGPERRRDRAAAV